MLRWLALIGLCGCYNPRNYGFCEAGVCPTEIDAAIDADIDSASICIGRKTPPFHEVCLDPLRPALNLIAVKTFNTNTECDMTIPQPGTMAPELCVFAYERVTILNTNVFFTGARIPVLLGRDGLSISAGSSINVATQSLSPAYVPAGSNFTGCMAPSGGDTNTDTGSGGGAGGSFRFNGGDGGDGSGGNSEGATAAAEIALPLFVRGGCGGGRGGNTTAAGAAGGGSGGAVYLMSRETIAILGVVNASGAGGTATDNYQGGAGGGSGGMIVIDGKTLTTGGATKVFALGAGGSAGGQDASGFGGGRGNEPDASFSPVTSVANGSAGFGGGTTGMGAPGGVGAPNGTTCSTGCGGGGGGGGAGFVVVPAQHVADLPVMKCLPSPTGI